MNALEILSLVALITGILSCVLSVIILFNGRDGKHKRLKNVFGVLTAFFGAWSVSYFFWLSSDSKEQAAFWVGMLNVGSTFIPVVYYNWFLVLLNKKRNILLYAGYVVTSVFALFSFTDLYFIDLVPIAGFPFWPQAGILYPYVILLFFGFYGLIMLEVIGFLRDKNITRSKKSILKVISFVLTISLVAGATNFPMWFGIYMPPYGNIVLICAHVFLIVYAMLKYNFMNMKIFYIQVAVGLIIVLSLINIFVSNPESLLELTLETVSFVVLILFSVLLVKTSQEEVRQKKELKQTAAELTRTNVELRRLDNAKSEFISIASHQLRTPLTAIKGYISLILEGNYDGDENAKKGALNKIYLSNERLVQLVEDLLNITHIEAGRLEFNLEDNVQIDDILKELKDAFVLTAKDKGLEFTVKTMDTKASPVKADKSKLREVISNLIDNAIKYTKEGFVHVYMEEEADIIRVIVEDSGMGISKKLSENLFVKFSRGMESSKIYTEGTGLGLYVCKNLIESQGGIIYAQSEGQDKGSRFIIEMPIAK